MTTVDAKTTSGTVRGELTDGIAAYRGIPFAEPPFGPNLFKTPLPRALGGGCVSAPPTARAARSRPRASSGTSQRARTSSRSTCGCPKTRPAAFWIHGGGVTLGSNAEPGSDGRAFARDGAVFVSCTYRLGAFGFLHAGHLGDGYAAASGAYGLADQIAALRWTRDNIANFGGDPGNVMIFGASAGGTFVRELLGCPRCAGAVPPSGVAERRRASAVRLFPPCTPNPSPSSYSASSASPRPSCRRCPWGAFSRPRTSWSPSCAAAHTRNADGCRCRSFRWPAASCCRVPRWPPSPMVSARTSRS
ncbi:carboxylesterase family protein [Amycolatopsis ultiminotia]|uniref:carboxylesterase family protein n=1 Tax=Amycolatopsis ultiminotia TaxID=543629 RepID=UPI003CD090EF